MLIVLEGCDGVGKTYLAELLKQEIIKRKWPAWDTEARAIDKIKIRHSGVPSHADMYDEYDLSWYRPGKNEHWILDRWHLGEWVYGRLYRGASLLGMRGLDRIDHQLQELGALRLIVSETNLSMIRARLKNKNEDYLQDRDVRKVLVEYNMLAEHFRWFKITSRHDPALLIDWADSLEKQAGGAW